MLEFENNAHWMDAQDTIAVRIKGEKTKQKILRIVNKYPGMIAHDEKDGQMLAIIPKKCIKIKATKKTKRIADRERKYDPKNKRKGN